MWTQKYRPESFSDIVGNSKQIKQLVKWGKSWSKDSDALVLHGPAGVGKTTSAHILVKELGWDIIEMNASDSRTKNIVKSVAGESSRTATFAESDRRLILLDEADNLHGNADRGGKSAIKDVINESRQPIILIANNYYDLSRSLRNNTRDIEFEKVDEKGISKRLRRICNTENINFDSDDIAKIAKGSDGDVRAAVNDLEKAALGEESLSVDNLGQSQSRDKDQEIFPLLDDILKSGDPHSVREKSRNLDMTPYEMFRWIDRNMYREYTSEEQIESIEYLSKASVWLGRVNSTQNYKFWRYASDNLTAGVASSRKNQHGGWTRWQPPRYGSSSKIGDDTIKQISQKNWTDMETARTEIAPFISALIPYCKPKKLAIDISAEYQLNEKQIAELTGSGKNTNKVNDIVDEAEENISEFEIEYETASDEVFNLLTDVDGLTDKCCIEVSKEFDSVGEIRQNPEQLKSREYLSNAQSELILEEVNTIEQDETKDEETDKNADLDDFI